MHITSFRFKTSRPKLIYANSDELIFCFFIGFFEIIDLKDTWSRRHITNDKYTVGLRTKNTRCEFHVVISGY